MKSISLPNLKNKVQAVVNEYIRKRDSDFGYFKCISCGKLKSIEFMDAGHYYSTKMYDDEIYEKQSDAEGCFMAVIYGVIALAALGIMAIVLLWITVWKT